MRSDFAAGVIASTVANVNRKRGTKPFRPRDFMAFVPDEKAGTLEAFVDAMRAMAERSEAKQKRAARQ